MRPVQPSQQRSVPETLPCTNGALVTPAMEFLAIVRWAVKQREIMMHHGWSRLEPAHATRMLMPLQTWLNSHPTYLSAEGAKACWAKWSTQIREVMPGSAAGRKKADRLDKILPRL